MKRVIVIATIGLVVGGILGPPAVAVAAKEIQDVFITNTSADPVPVAGTVNVGNLPASQEVRGTVNVANLPATQAVTGTVNVGNAVDHAPAEPFDSEVLLEAGTDGKNFDIEELFQVPEGKTAVIETVSARFFAEPGVVPALNILERIVGDHSSRHFVAMSQESVAEHPTRPGFQRTAFVGTQTIRLYAPSGSNISADLFVPVIAPGDPTALITGNVSITGYLVDAPAS